MKDHMIIAALLACLSVPLIAQTAAAPSLSSDEVIARMLSRDAEREIAAGGYTGAREYDLVNRLLAKRSRMVVNVSSAPDGTEHFAIASQDGWNSGNSALRQSLQSESELSRPAVRRAILFSKDNYIFQMDGTADLNGRAAYVIDVAPKRQETYLFRGRIWVDAEDYALARVDAQLARTPSFWIRSVHVMLEFHKSGAYWFPYVSTSTSDLRIFGPTEVNIRFVNYSALSASPEKHPALLPLETSYVKR